MSTLPKYSEDETTCVKCGMVEAQTEYMPALIGVDLDRTQIHDAPFHSEFLKRTCVRCGYMWAEKCADWCERCESTGVDPEDSIPAEGPSYHSLGEPPVPEPCRDCTPPRMVAAQKKAETRLLPIRCKVCKRPLHSLQLGDPLLCTDHL